ncbi:MAG: YeeE/YedE thiosulfate transporter family protein [Trueperaceae bacterium]
MDIIGILRSPWPWYVAGPLIGLTVPLLLVLGNKAFGVSSNIRHLCAMIPNSNPFFNYDWRRAGGWNLLFALGIIIGGFIGGVLLANPNPLTLAPATAQDLQQMGLAPDGNLVPAALFDLGSLSFGGLLLMVLGGFLVGFGTRWAGGCTSGHSISGLANLQVPSLVATIAFFIGGMIGTYLLLPLILGLG